MLYETYIGLINPDFEVPLSNSEQLRLFTEDHEGNPEMIFSSQKFLQTKSSQLYPSLESQYGKFREGISEVSKAMLIIEANQHLITGFPRRKIFDTFKMTTAALFMPEEVANSDQDVEMEESKIDTKAITPLKSEAELAHKHWEVNIKEKLDLKNYTKRYPSSRIKTKPKKVNKGLAAISNLQKIHNPVEADKIMSEINLEKDFELDYPELLTKYEFPGVLRLKKKFMVWFCNHMHVKIQQKKREIDEKRIQREEKERLNRIKEEEEYEAKARKDTYKVDQRQLSKTNDQIDIDEIDPLEENPSKVLRCAYCLRYGQRKKSGRLIPFRANQFIHTN